MVLIWSYNVQFFTIFCLFTFWSSSTYGSEPNFGIIPTPNLLNHRFGPQKITFPEPVAADKYHFLFEATLPLPRKPYPGKDLKYKQYFYKPKPIFGYNYRKLYNTPARIPFFPPYVHKGSLYHLTQNVLKQTQVNQDNKYNEELHDPGIKPVVENIKDDIKYDFRTKMHYYER
nr:uncharacterized protein LOC111414905 [Onthophagus taurus]